MMVLMTNVGSVTALPTVDLRARPKVLRDGLRAAAHNVGFFYLTGHGVPEALVAKVFDAASRLFALPQADKDAIAMVRSPHFRGYTRLGGELTRGEVDWREQIDIGPERPPIGGPGRPDYLWLQGPNQWPSALPELPGIVAEWDAALAKVSGHLLRHWAASLGAPAELFDAAFAESPATLIKIIRYPAHAASSQGVGPHKDSGVLTLLLAEPGSRGLQVRPPGSPDWVDVPPLEGRSSSISASCSSSRPAATCARPSIGWTSARRPPNASRWRISSTRGWMPGSRCWPQVPNGPPPNGRRRPIRRIRSTPNTAATPGRAGCARTRMWLPRTATRRGRLQCENPVLGSRSE